MENRVTLPRLIATIALLWATVLVGAILMSMQEMGLGEGLRRIVDTKWGITTLIDLYAGLAFVAVWIGVCEKSIKRGVLWGVALALTGNLAMLVYLAWRAWRAESVLAIFTPTSPSARVMQPRSMQE